MRMLAVVVLVGCAGGSAGDGGDGGSDPVDQGALDPDGDGLTNDEEGALGSYHYAPSVRGDMLARLGRLDEARREFERAATMTDNLRERALLRRRAERCGSGG